MARVARVFVGVAWAVWLAEARARFNVEVFSLAAQALVESASAFATGRIPLVTIGAELGHAVAAACLVVPVVAKRALLWQALAIARLVVEVKSNLTGRI